MNEKIEKIENFIKNNNLVLSHTYTDKIKSPKRPLKRVTYCILNDLSDTQKESLTNFYNNNNLKNTGITLKNSKYSPHVLLISSVISD